MTLTYYGHCAFLWTTNSGVRVLVDPFGNSDASHWFLTDFPEVDTDVTLVTHDHFDHNAIDRVPGLPSIIRGPGYFRLGDMSITGVLDLHSGRSGRRGLRNTMYVIEHDGVRYCHIGDNRHDMPLEAVQAIGEIDVLMVTVDDSCHLLSYEQVDSLIDVLSPKIVVPMHYYLEGVTTASSTLLSPDSWLATQDRVKLLDRTSIDLAPSQVPDSREVWVLVPERDSGQIGDR